MNKIYVHIMNEMTINTEFKAEWIIIYTIYVYVFWE